MAAFCCCTAPRSSKTRSLGTRDQVMLPTPLPPVRLPGPLTLSPIIPVSVGLAPISSTLLSSTHPSVPTAIVPIDPVELGQLVVEDSDTDDELDPRLHNKSTSTLQLVRTHIRRHLSQDSLPRQKARSAVGCSQEEIERRAELKRLMHKRIQEELRSEESRETARSDVASSGRQRASSINFLPSGGPRDNIVFSVTDDSKLETQCMSDTESNDLTPPGKHMSGDENSPLEQRRASCPDVLPKPVARSLVRERSSLPQMPLSPELLPKRSPSTHETSSTGSWRLWYNASQLDELLGYPDRGHTSRDDSSIQRLSFSPISVGPVSPSCRMPFSGHSHLLSRSHSSPARQSTPVDERPSMMDQSPLSTWLRSQGLRSNSPSFSALRTSEDDQEEDIQEAEVVYLRRCGSVQDCAVPEADLLRPEIVHLYDMDIHRQLVTRAFNTPEDSTGYSGSGKNSIQERSEGQYSPRGVNAQQLDTANRMCEANQKAQTSMSNEPSAWAVTNPSSVYPSTANSADQSPGTSSYQVPDWAINHKYPLAFMMPNYNWLGNSGNPYLPPQSDGSSRPTAAGDSFNCVNSPDTFTQTGPRSPLPASTPPSQTRRDTSTDRAEKSIGRFRLGSGAPATIVTRFQKRTDEDATAPEPAMPSLLARLHLTFPRRVKLAPRSFDGASPDEQEKIPRLSTNHQFASNLNRPSSRASDRTNPSPYSLSSPGVSVCEDSTAELWQKAIQEEARLRHLGGKTHDNHSRRSSYPDGDLHKTPPSTAAALKHHRSSLAVYKDSHSFGKETERPTISPVSATSREIDYVPSPISWLDHVAKEAALLIDRNTPADGASTPQANTKSHVDKVSWIPESWARFSSHNRAERNGTASDDNNVAPAELAGGAEREPTDHSTDKSIKSTQKLPKRGSSSLPGRLGKAVKSKFNKLIPSKASPGGSSPRSSKSSRKSTDRHQRGLEYPELELPPSEDGLRELKALEHEIEHMRGLPRGRCPATLEDSSGTKITLSAKMATLLHTDGAAELLPPRIPAPSYARDSTTTSTDRFVTPLSSMSANHDNLSLHSYPHLRPHSQGLMPFSGEVLAETTSDIDSVRSDTVLSKVLRSATASDVDSGFFGSTVGAPKFETWGGRSRTLPYLSSERLEQLDGIDWSHNSSGSK